jgi:hypothetical protein
VRGEGTGGSREQCVRKHLERPCWLLSTTVCRIARAFRTTHLSATAFSFTCWAAFAYVSSGAQ